MPLYMHINEYIHKYICIYVLCQLIATKTYNKSISFGWSAEMIAILPRNSSKCEKKTCVQPNEAKSYKNYTHTHTYTYILICVHNGNRRGWIMTVL